MSKEFRWLLIWIFGGTVAFFLCLSILGGTIIEKQSVPSDQDAFYHARRILDTAFNPAAFYEFDKKIHAPEGSLLVWPWAYDYLMGQGVRFVSHWVSVKDPFEILAYFPSVWVFVNAALVLGIASVLNFSGLGKLLAILCFALLPSTKFLHRPGYVDHHFIEATFSLLTLFFGMLAAKEPKSYFRATLLGITLGIAPAFQSGLFILQFPVLLYFVFEWFSKGKLIGLSTRMLGFSLVASNLFMLIFSQPFLEGQFNFYYYGWFHLYISLISMATLVFMTYISFSPKNFLLLILLGVSVSLPIIKQFIFGSEFIFNKVVDLQSTGEMQPPWGRWQNYTILLFSFPVFLLMFSVESIRSKTSYLKFCAMYLIFVGFLMSAQSRFDAYGFMVLFFPVIFLFEKQVNALVLKWKIICQIIFTVCLLACFYIIFLQIQGEVFQGFGNDKPDPKQRMSPIVAGELAYEYMFPIFPALNKYCQDDPGIILTDPHFGNYLRYHTSCSVIANRMLITPQHFQKAARVQALLEGSLEDFLKNPEKIKYILVSLRGEWGKIEDAPNASSSTNAAKLPSLTISQPINPEGLSAVLLYHEANVWAEHFELLEERSIKLGGNGDIRWLRFFKVKEPKTNPSH